MKKLLVLLLAVCLLAGVMAVPVTAKKLTAPFTDVTEDDWFYSDVAYAYSLGLVNGKTADLYMPDDNLTYAEAVKLAACMNQYYTDGEVTLTVKGDPWYDTYVEYCNDNGIIKKGYSWDKNATRAGYMEIFANSLPDEALKEINYIEDGSIPDVKSSADYYDAVYKLYRAGILTGVDDEHNCSPAANIKRSEVAAIITRMMDEDARREFTMGDPKNADKDKDDKDKDKKEELTVTADVTDIALEAGVEVTLVPEVHGGKEPYTFEWSAPDRIVKHSRFNSPELDSEEAVAAGFHLVEYGDDGSVTFFIDGRPAASLFPKIICTVTDDEGNKGEVTYKIIYAGSDSFNDLATDDFLMYVEDDYWITDRGLIATGRIVNGKVKVGDRLRLLKLDGTEKEVTVGSIEMFRKMMDQAEKGDNVGILLEGLGETNEEAKKNIERGEALLGENTEHEATKYAVIELTMLTKDEGGRTTAPSGDGSYKPQAYIGTSDFTATLTNEVYDEEGDAWNTEDLEPGKTYDNVWMELSASYVFMYPGQEGTIREGGRNVGTFKIVDVYPADDEEDTEVTLQELSISSISDYFAYYAPVLKEKYTKK